MNGLLQHCIFLCFAISLHHRVIGQKTAVMVKRGRVHEREAIKLNTESFRRLVFESKMLVDRTLLIKEILQHPAKRMIIACPPKWGKSINLHMIKTFLQMEVDENGRQYLPVNNTLSYVLFKRGEGFYGSQNESFAKPFLISRHQDVFDKHLCQYPVIHMRLRFVEGLNDVEAIQTIQNVMKKIYTPHKYLVKILKNIYTNTDEREHLKKEKAKYYYETFERIINEQETDEQVLSDCLALLCKLLYRQHRKRVVLLIDDYDLPFFKILHLRHFSDFDMKYVLKHLQSILDPVLAEDYPYIERVIITATHRFTDILGPNMKSMPDFTLLDNPWIEYFGVNDRDYQQLCKQASMIDKLCQQGSEWYMGYRMGYDHGPTYGQLFSISNFLATNELKLYTFRYVEFDYVYRMLKITQFREIFELLINRETVDIRVPNGLRFSRAEITRFKDIVVAESDQRLEPSMVDFALSYLCATGYLSFLKSNVTSDAIRIWLPNIESFVDISRKLTSYYHKTYNVTHIDVVRLVYNLRDFLANNSKRPLSGINIYLNQLFDNLRVYNATHSRMHNITYVNDYMHSLMKYISLTWQNLAKAESITWIERNTTAIYMLSVKRNRALIFALQFNIPPQDLLNAARNQRYRLEKYKQLQFLKYVVCTFTPEKIIKVTTDAELVAPT